MAKAPATDTIAAELTVQARVLLFCLASDTDWFKAGVAPSIAQHMLVRAGELAQDSYPAMPFLIRNFSALIWARRRRTSRRAADRFAHFTLMSGPAPIGKFDVLRTWIPALCSPLKGVTVLGQPAFAASAGLLNHIPT
jgi:hypothetical protein